MKNTQAQIKALSGLYEKLPQPQDSATELVNWTVDKYTGGWDNRIGYERYNPIPPSAFNPFGALPRIDSICVFNRHQGAQQAILFESGGTLYQYTEWNYSIAIIDNDRTIPTINEACTQYIPYSRWMVIFNGYEKPIRYAGWPVFHNSVTFAPFKYDLGWHNVPGAPWPWGITTDPSLATDVGNTICIFFDNIDPFECGIGHQTKLKANKHKWKVSYINNAGSESPLSDASREVEWTTPDPAMTFAAYVEIPTGPIGTVARRLYRTKNYSEDGSGNQSLKRQLYMIVFPMGL